MIANWLRIIAFVVAIGYGVYRWYSRVPPPAPVDLKALNARITQLESKLSSRSADVGKQRPVVEVPVVHPATNQPAVLTIPMPTYEHGIAFYDRGDGWRLCVGPTDSFGVGDVCTLGYVVKVFEGCAIVRDDRGDRVIYRAWDDPATNQVEGVASSQGGVHEKMAL